MPGIKALIQLIGWSEPFVISDIIRKQREENA